MRQDALHLAGEITALLVHMRATRPDVYEELHILAQLFEVTTSQCNIVNLIITPCMLLTLAGIDLDEAISAHLAHLYETDGKELETW